MPIKKINDHIYCKKRIIEGDDNKEGKKEWT
jgi:hypothetical protein